MGQYEDHFFKKFFNWITHTRARAYTHRVHEKVKINTFNHGHGLNLTCSRASISSYLCRT